MIVQATGKGRDAKDPPESHRRILEALGRLKVPADLFTLERYTGIDVEELFREAMVLGARELIIVEWRYVRRRFLRPKEYLCLTRAAPGPDVAG